LPLIVRVKKGQQVIVEGSARNKNWTDKKGQKRYGTEISVEQVYFADSRRDGGGDNRESTPTENASVAPVSAVAGDGFYTVNESEDLPF